MKLEIKNILETAQEKFLDISIYIDSIRGRSYRILNNFLGNDRRKESEFREDLNFLSIIAHSSYTSLIELDAEESIIILWQSEKIQNYGCEKIFNSINKERLKGYLIYSRENPNETVFTDITIHNDRDNILYLTLKYTEDVNHYYIHFVPSKDSYTSIKNDFDIMINSVKVRDFETAGHQKRVTEMSVLLSKLLMTLTRYSSIIDQNFVDKMRVGASLHDVGKIGISDTILLSPNKLTNDEMNEMRKHSEIGAKMIESLEEEFGHRKLIDFAKNIALSHHERWNGNGYPFGLVGDNIPLCAQIVAVIDVFDALMSKRPYKEPISIEQVKDILIRGRGIDFNPEILDVFLSNFDQFVIEREKNK